MATVITPALETLVNTTSQDLFTINTVTTIPAVSGHEAQFPAMLGAVYYSPKTSPQRVVFDTVSANVGTDITSNVSAGTFTLAGTANIAYQLTGYITVRGAPGTGTPTYGWINTGTGLAIGGTAPVGIPVSTTFVNTTGNAVTVALQVQNSANASFVYPAQVQAAAATVTEVSGYTVA
jgi:hypothetical protein